MDTSKPHLMDQALFDHIMTIPFHVRRNRILRSFDRNRDRVNNVEQFLALTPSKDGRIFGLSGLTVKSIIELQNKIKKINPPVPPVKTPRKPNLKRDIFDHIDLLEQVLLGSTYVEMAKRENQSIERVRQVAHKACRILYYHNAFRKDVPVPKHDYTLIKELRDHATFWLAEIALFRLNRSEYGKQLTHALTTAEIRKRTHV